MARRVAAAHRVGAIKVAGRYIVAILSLTAGVRRLAATRSTQSRAFATLGVRASA
jgi:hypothetical protein